MSLIQVNIVHCSRKGHPKGLMLTVSWNYPYFLGIIRLLVKTSARGHRLALVVFAYMFRLFKESLIESQIKVYLASRQGIAPHAEYLHEYKKFSHIKNVSEATYESLEAYRMHKQASTSNYTQISAMKALRCFIRHYKSLAKVDPSNIRDFSIFTPVGQNATVPDMPVTLEKKTKRGRPRNIEAVKKVRLLKDKGGLSFRAISTAMKKDVKTVHEWYKMSFDDEIVGK